jgi:hypothetical protein
VIETIPKHVQFVKDPQYISWQQVRMRACKRRRPSSMPHAPVHVHSHTHLKKNQIQFNPQQAAQAIAELDRLKVSLKLRNVERPAARSLNRPTDAALLVTSNLPDIDWGTVGAAADPFGPSSVDSRFGAEAAEWQARAHSGAFAGPSSGGSSGGYGGAAFGAAAAGAVGAAAAAAGAMGPPAPGRLGSFSSGGGAAPPPPPAYQSAYVPVSQQSLDRHALFAPRAAPGRSPSSAAPPRPRYPEFEKSAGGAPPPIDALWQQQSGGGGQDAAAAPSAPPEAALAGLALSDPRRGSLLDAPMAPHPSAGPSLGPQEVQVFGMDPSAGRPGGSCAAHHAVVEAPPLSGVGLRPLEKRVEMRDVHISVALMNDFLHYASTNTRRWVLSLVVCVPREAGITPPPPPIHPTHNHTPTTTTHTHAQPQRRRVVRHPGRHAVGRRLDLPRHHPHHPEAGGDERHGGGAERGGDLRGAGQQVGGAVEVVGR